MWRGTSLSITLALVRLGDLWFEVIRNWGFGGLIDAPGDCLQ